MDLEKLRKIVKGAYDLALSECGAGRDMTAVIPLLQKALEDVDPQEMRQLLLKAATK